MPQFNYPTFRLIAGHSTLDFVNTLDDRFSEGGGRELLNSYADLLSFARQAVVLDAAQVQALAGREQSTKAANALRSARDLRESLAVLFYETLGQTRKQPPPDMKNLERHFLRADQHRELIWNRTPDDGGAVSRATWRWGVFAADLELPIWAIAQSSAQLLTSSAMDHVRMCGSETCRWLFHDTSKNHSRRWCDMKICGNRMKARRFQHRRD